MIFPCFSHDFPGFSHDFPVTSHEIVAQISFSVTSRISSTKRPTPRWATAAWDGWPPASWTGEAAERRWDAPKMVSSLTKIGDLSNKLVIYPRKLVIYPRKLVIDPTKLVIWSKNGGVMRVLSGFFMEFWMDTFRYSWLGNPRTKWKFPVDFGFSIAWFFHQKNWDINTIL